MGRIEEHVYDTPEELAEALATGVAAVLAGGIATNGSASLAVSGGSTPGRFFDHLSRTEIDWSAVIVTLVDERFVPEDHPRSNAALVRSRLLVNRAADAQFVPHYRAGDPEDAAAQLAIALERTDGPDALVLGMGTDGHTASFFPDGDKFANAIDPEGDALALPIHVPSQGEAGETRITLTLSAIRRAHFVALHIEGSEKARVLDDAKAGADLPIAKVIAALDEIEVFRTA